MARKPMFQIIAWSVAALIAGYLVGLFGGMWLITLLSSNRHDKAMEAAMTSAFVIGPVIAILAFVITLVSLLKK
jgi:TRAP-type C4-dicarboxylate transport system permease small subunit